MGLLGELTTWAKAPISIDLCVILSEKTQKTRGFLPSSLCLETPTNCAESLYRETCKCGS